LGVSVVFGRLFLGMLPRVERRVEPKELVKFVKKCKDENARERAVAIILLLAGFSEKDVARMLGRSDRTVRNWLAKWNESGFEGLLEKRGDE